MKITAASRRVAVLTLALTALAGVAAVPASAQTAPPAGRCTLLITSVHPQIRHNERIVSSCTPRAATDKLIQTGYYGADWPDLDDWLFFRNYPPLTDNFLVSRYDLNEDLDTGDEVYTRNRFQRADGSSYEIRSSEIHRQFVPFLR